MKIEYKKKNTMLFTDLNNGELFSSNNTSPTPPLYMKIPAFAIKNIDNNVGSNFNSITLDGGVLSFFNFDSEIIPLKAKLVVEA